MKNRVRTHGIICCRLWRGTGGLCLNVSLANDASDAVVGISSLPKVLQTSNRVESVCITYILLHVLVLRAVYSVVVFSVDYVQRQLVPSRGLRQPSSLCYLL